MQWENILSVTLSRAFWTFDNDKFIDSFLHYQGSSIPRNDSITLNNNGRNFAIKIFPSSNMKNFHYLQMAKFLLFVLAIGLVIALHISDL